MREAGPGNTPNVASADGPVYTPDAAFQGNCSHAGAVTVTVAAPEFPAPGAAKVKLNAPPAAVAKYADPPELGAAQPTPERPGEPLSRTHRLLRAP